MNPFPVSARSLCRRQLRLTDRAIDEVCVFPLFDRTGRVSWIMVLEHEPAEIWLARWQAACFRVPMWGEIICTRSGDVLTPARSAVGSLGKDVWHYDPWWLLNDDRYAGKPAADALKATNCVGQLAPGVKMLYFRRDLSRISLIRAQNKASVEYKGWNASKVWMAPMVLPRFPARSLIPTRRRSPEWRLDPIWKRWTDKQASP